MIVCKVVQPSLEKFELETSGYTLIAPLPCELLLFNPVVRQCSGIKGVFLKCNQRYNAEIMPPIRTLAPDTLRTLSVLVGCVLMDFARTSSRSVQ